MDRRRVALALLMAFVACIGVAVVVSGNRPGLQQGIAPTVAAYVGYLLALGAAALLLVRDPAGPARSTRTIGVMVLGAVVVLVVLELLVPDDGGANIGAGFVRLIGLVVIMVATIRLALGVAAAGRAR